MDAERGSRDGGLAVLPGLSFLSFLPRAVAKSRPSLLCHPPVCSPLCQRHPPPQPSPLPLANGAQPKEVWPRVQLGPVSCRKISSISHSTKAKVCKQTNKQKNKDVGFKFLEQELQTLHLPEEKLPATEGAASKMETEDPVLL